MTEFNNLEVLFILTLFAFCSPYHNWKRQLAWSSTWQRCYHAAEVAPAALRVVSARGVTWPISSVANQDIQAVAGRLINVTAMLLLCKQAHSELIWVPCYVDILIKAFRGDLAH